jgi:hypothetical protein
MMNPGLPDGAHGASAHQANLDAAKRAEEERQRRRDEEEEALTPYGPEDLANDWQFKIVKGTFKTAKQIEAVQEEMAVWGWVLVEVFDQTRVRFKRSAGEGAKDAERDGNPFRTISNSSGPGCGSTVVVLGLIVVGMAWWLA